MKDNKNADNPLVLIGSLIIIFCILNIGVWIVIAFFSAFGDVEISNPGLVTNIVGVISAIITVWLGIMAAVDSVQQRKRAEQNARERKLRQLQQRTAAAQLRFPPVISLPQHVLLRRGERCHYQGKATLLVIKHEVVGHRTSYSGSSVEILDGFSLDSGSGYSQAVRGLVPYTYPGLLTITSQRVIMTGESSFEHSVSSLTSMQFLENYDGLELQFGGTTCKLLLDDPFIVDRILNLVR